MENIQIQQIDPLTATTRGRRMLWKRLIGTGIVMALLGMVAIILPFVATITIQAILAAVLIVAGITHLIHAFQSSQPKGFVLRLLVSGVYGFFGILLMVYPFKGALTLTVLLALLFMISGAFKVAHALAIKPFASWSWLMVSGILSVFLGLIIWLALPQAANWTIGLLVGIELLFSGWAMIMYAISLKKYNQAIE